MSYIVSQGTRLYWEERGSGPPVLLIMGLSFTHEMWYRIVPALERSCRLILFDNRGVGESDVPGGRYSMSQLARDAVAVLDAAGIPAAHVLGASMGGMIAQELALRFPERVLSLLLACTSHGGVLARWPNFPRLRGRGWCSRNRREQELSLVPMLYSSTTSADRIEEDIGVLCRSSLSYTGFFGQLSAILPWSSFLRLPRIQVPTMVIHGDRDRLVPPGNGRTVAARIPGAQFHLIEDAGHILTTDQPEACERLMLLFLEQMNPRVTEGLSGNEANARLDPANA